jgi:hypothetical protein
MWQLMLYKYSIRACVTPGLSPNGLRRDTQANGRTDNVAAPK